MLTPQIQAEFVAEAPDVFVKANRDILTGALHAAWKLRVEKSAGTRSRARKRRQSPT
jgi:hypothetical protein